MKMELRDYQIEACDAIMEKFKTHQSTMAVLFTSAGKTTIFSTIIQRFTPARTLILVGQSELAKQAARSVKQWTGIDSDIEMAGSRARTDLKHCSQVVIATWQTLVNGGKPAKHGSLFDTPSKRRMQRFKPTDFDLIVIDEFHHAAAPSYKVILDYFKQNPKIKILGVTATPKRGDGLALGEICQSLAYNYPIEKGRDNGWLVNIAQHVYEIESLDYSGVKKTGDDLNDAQVKRIVESQENVAGMCHPTLEVMFGCDKHELKTIPVEKWREHLESKKDPKGNPMKPRPTVMFTVSVEQARLACEVFNRVIPGIAGYVHGKMNEVERETALSDFETGKTSLLANVGITVEGWDCPKVEVIAMAAPTLSISKFLQQLGRGTRVLPGVIDGLLTKEERIAAIKASAKPYLRIIDFVGNSGRHHIINAFNALGGNMPQKTIEKAMKLAAMDDKPKSVLKTLTQAEVEIEQERIKELQRKRDLEAARKISLVPKSNYHSKEVDPFTGDGINKPMPTTSKQKKEFSIPVTRQLLRLGFPIDMLGFEQGNQIIRRTAANKWKLSTADKQLAQYLWQQKKQKQQPVYSMEQQAKADWERHMRTQVGL